MKKLLSLALAMCMMASLSLTLASADNSDLDIVPSGEACPQCSRGTVLLSETVYGDWRSNGVGHCVCPLYDNANVGQRDEVLSRTVEKHYACDTCAHNYWELSEEIWRKHLG